MNPETRRRVNQLLQEIIDLLEHEGPPPTEPASNVTPIRKDDEVELEGVIGRPELKEVRGTTLFTAGLKVTEGERDTWVNLAAWGRTAEAASTITRGMIVRVVGKAKEVDFVDSYGVMRSKRELTASVISPVNHAGHVSSVNTA